MLEVDGIGVQLGGRAILRDVSFSIHAGEFAGLIGPNGAGKTTLLRVILGLIRSDRRSSPDRRRPAPSEHCRDRLRPAEGAPRSRTCRCAHGTSSRSASTATASASGFAAHVSEPLASRRCSTRWTRRASPIDGSDFLSGGEQQRVLIAHALVSRPKLLLLDEPLANLDISSEHEVVALLARIASEQRIAVLLSAHDINPLLGVMDRVVYVAGGRSASGTADEVVRPEVLSALYGHQVDVIHALGRVIVVAGEHGNRSLGGSISRRRSRFLPPRRGCPAPSRRGSGTLIANVLSPIIEPGFFSTTAVQYALVVGGAVAFTAAVVGMFTVMRRQSFAGEALGDVGTTGGSAAFLVSINPLWGFIAATLLAAGVIEAAGTRRAHNRDLATGIVLGGALGLAALFLYFDSTHSSTTGASITVLFGSLFVINPSVVPIVLGLCAGVLVAQVLLHRVLVSQ